MWKRSNQNTEAQAPTAPVVPESPEVLIHSVEQQIQARIRQLRVEAQAKFDQSPVWRRGL